MPAYVGARRALLSPPKPSGLPVQVSDWLAGGGSYYGQSFASVSSYLAGAGGDFTRASDGAYFDASGVLQFATSGNLRLDRDPETLENLGFRVEGARTNSARQNAGARTDDVALAGTQALGATAPDGTARAMTMTDNSATAAHGWRVGGGAASPDDNAAFSMYVKAVTYDYFGLTQGGLAATSAIFDKSGKFTAYPSYNGFYPDSKVQKLINDWLRVDLSGLISRSATQQMYIYMQPTGVSATATYLGTGAGQFLNAFPQLERDANFPSSPIITAAVVASRAADVLKFSGFPVANVGSIVIKAKCAPGLDYFKDQVLWQADDGTENNRIRIVRLGFVSEARRYPNLITNGDFSTGDLTGWTNSSTGTGAVSNSGNKGRLVGDTTNRAILSQQLANVKTWKDYLLLVTGAITSGNFGLSLRDAFSASTYIRGSLATNTTYAHRFPANSFTVNNPFVYFGSNATSSDVTIDDVEVREMDSRGIYLIVTISGVDIVTQRIGAAPDLASINVAVSWGGGVWRMSIDGGDTILAAGGVPVVDRIFEGGHSAGGHEWFGTIARTERYDFQKSEAEIKLATDKTFDPNISLLDKMRLGIDWRRTGDFTVSGGLASEVRNVTDNRKYIQATGTAQPAYALATGLVFDGLDDNVLLTGALMPVNSPWHYFGLLDEQSTASQTGAIGWGGSTRLFGINIGSAIVSSVRRFYARIGNNGSSGDVIDTTTVATGLHTVEVWYDGTTAWISVDGNAPVSAVLTQNISAAGRTRLGAWNDSTITNPFKGNQYVHFGFTEVLTGEWLTRMRAYMAAAKLAV